MVQDKYLTENKPLRILHVFSRLDKGGAETIAMNILRNSDKSRIIFDFVVHTTDICAYEEAISLGSRIFCLPRYNGRNHIQYIAAWKKLLSEHTEWHIIHASFSYTAPLYFKMAKKKHLITIAHSHNSGNKGGIKGFIQKCYTRLTKADYYFACSEAAGKFQFGKKILNEPDFLVFKNPVYVDKFRFDEQTRAKKRKELGLTGKFVIGNVGRLSAPKNHFFLLNIFAETARLNDNMRLLLVGDGELLDNIIEQARNLGIYDKIIFSGVTTDVSSMLSAMDLFVFPSLWEGFGNVLLEAQANGLTCIVSDVIQPEVMVTDNIKVVSLKESAQTWAEIIMNLANHMPERDLTAAQKIKDAGFDIYEQTEWVTRFYENAVRKR